MQIQIHDKIFVPFLSAANIQAAIQVVAQQINYDLAGTTPLFMPVLNGSVFFATDLLRYITLPCEIAFIKTRSYHGTNSTGTVEVTWVDKPNLAGRTIVIVEDIIDTGHTLTKLLALLSDQKPAAIKIACLLEKPEANCYPNLKPDYIGIQIPNKFVVGYGLDYNGQGRNLPEIYQLKE